MTRSARVLAASAILFAAGTPGRAETVRLEATADVWVSAFRGEEGHTAGRHPVFKLKSIQEMAVIRFDASPAAGRQVRGARLFLRRAGEDMLRYLRVSTVNADWVEGTNAERLSPGDGASYDFADTAAKRPWAWGPRTAADRGSPTPWQGSQLCDVIMTSGNTLATWAERKARDDGWISLPLTPELIHALVAGDTDGLAVMDGGTPAFSNNFIHSVQSKSPPYIEVELGEKLDAVPAAPQVKAEPDPSRAHVGSGAVRIEIAPAADVFCWRVKLDGTAVPRWQVKHPPEQGATVFWLDDLRPARLYALEVAAVSPAGTVSPATTLRVRASPALPEPPSLGRLAPPRAPGAMPASGPAVRVWACPPLVKISPETGAVMFADASEDPRRANAVWDGRKVRLFGARGEHLSFQLVIERDAAGEPLRGVRVDARWLTTPAGGPAEPGDFELYRCWHARNKSRQWQPAYCVPLKTGATGQIPDPKQKLPKQRSQSYYVDVYVSKSARPGRYRGEVSAGWTWKSARAGRDVFGGSRAPVPIELEVLDFELPDELCFWPQLNSYRIPDRWHDYFRLAHDHRCVWYYRYGSGGPKVAGSGADLRIDWAWFDRMYGPLLSGEAFRDCRRAGVPVETIALPFWDSWPTPLTKQTYRYDGHWPTKGDDKKHLIAHYMTAPYIADALSDGYQQAFLAAQKQFFEHFRQKGWDRTEAQCVFVGKNTHRIDHGINMWWTTDEPYHWDDWLALRFFNRLWRKGRDAAGAEPKRWAARADISRPQWQGRVLDGAIDTVYFGGFADARTIRRCRRLARDVPLALRAYGAASPDNASNTRSLVWIVSAYLNGARAALPWQTLGSEQALDSGDAAVGGNALICPGERFGTGPVADIRLKAFRDAQQICEYLRLVARRRGLDREQLRVMVARAVRIEGAVRPGAAADNADALVFGTLKAWQIAALRRALAELIVGRPAR